MHLTMSFAKWRLSCLGLNVLYGVSRMSWTILSIVAEWRNMATAACCVKTLDFSRWKNSLKSEFVQVITFVWHKTSTRTIDGIISIEPSGKTVILEWNTLLSRSCVWKCRLQKASILFRPQCVNLLTKEASILSYFLCLNKPYTTTLNTFG